MGNSKKQYVYIPEINIDMIKTNLDFLDDMYKHMGKRTVYIKDDKPSNYNSIVYHKLNDGFEAVLIKAPLNLYKDKVEFMLHDIMPSSSDEYNYDPRVKISPLQKRRISSLLRSDTVSFYIKGSIIDLLYLRFNNDYDYIEELFPLSKSIIRDTHKDFTKERKKLFNSLLLQEWNIK